MPNRKTILIADDYDVVRQSIVDCFNEHFPEYNIEAFRDGTSLEERLKKDTNRVCVVVTDNNMPGIKGSQIIDKYASKIGFLFILFYAGDERIGQYLSNKYDNVYYVQKPDMDGLIKVMHDILD